ncbi:nitrate reductase molybdenum cofactor assembly chaperone [Schinkia sp. CFF1]
MTITDSRLTFQLCSYLLGYPNQEYLESLQDVVDEVETMSNAEIKNELLTYCQKANKNKITNLVSSYINTFDFGKKTNLYITYMSNGEQRERGMELLFLKNYYKLHGFNVTDKELPDYLPIMLEFAGLIDAASAKPVFERYLTNIEEISKNLNSEYNLYGHLLKAVLLALEEIGITNTEQRSETL